MRVFYRDKTELNGGEAWHRGSVSFSTLHEALRAIEAEGTAIAVDYVILTTIKGEVLLRQDDVKRLITIGKRGAGH